MRLNEDNVSEIQKQKASGALPTEFPTIEEKYEVHRIMMEVEPLLGASGYRTRRNILMTHGEYPTRESGVSVGHGGIILHGVARSKSTSVGLGG